MDGCLEDLPVQWKQARVGVTLPSRVSVPGWAKAARNIFFSFSCQQNPSLVRFVHCHPHRSPSATVRRPEARPFSRRPTESFQSRPLDLPSNARVELRVSVCWVVEMGSDATAKLNPSAGTDGGIAAE
ncbi:hypothetical protein JDV02_009853 [Purpureocillium takamizusanense]|uniref:Uncharacterized protein n=1 Tax=Purpureocillium takamizusanense TaxID=2060973 RepID=A0A9Q8QSK9_9HYPO|nr:uncharacterized protein JDV02_009853 [Purpureocillium takamizusanense]UNI24076.1 hypothetical protein JDV02_009853 [Purpureocillium takamizusanense]